MTPMKNHGSLHTLQFIFYQLTTMSPTSNDISSIETRFLWHTICDRCLIKWKSKVNEKQKHYEPLTDSQRNCVQRNIHYNFIFNFIIYRYRRALSFDQKRKMSVKCILRRAMNRNIYIHHMVNYYDYDCVLCYRKTIERKKKQQNVTH